MPSSQHKQKLLPKLKSLSKARKRSNRRDLTSDHRQVLPATIHEVGVTSTTGESSNPFCHINSTLFPNAREFTIENSNFYSAPGGSLQIVTNITEGPNAGNPDFPDLPVCEDVELEGELHKSGEYYLHRGRLRGRAVVVKAFKGPRAKQLCLKTAGFNRGMMHSNILRMIGVSDRNLGSSFLVFDGDFCGTAESQLALALKSTKEACIVGANTVIACSLGLDYLQEFLQDLGLYLPMMGPEHFVLMVSKQNRMVLSFDPEATWDAASHSDPNLSATAQAEKVAKICNELIQRTFYASCEKYYQEQRLYDDDDNEQTNQGFLESDDEEGDELPGFDHQLAQGWARPSHTRSLQNARKGHRQELVWKAHSTTSTSSSLREMGRHYQVSLERFRSENDVLVHRHGLSTPQTAHRCLGYKRTEIILSPDIEQSSIVSHTSPLPNEICSVCGENVGKLAQLEAPQRYEFEHGVQPSALSQSNLRQWNGNGDSQLFGSNSDQTLYGNAYGSYTSGLDGYGASDSSADMSGGLGSLSTTPPSVTFATVGLPFRGLDYIRNYNLNGYGTADQDSLWQEYDPGAFGYDPDLLFALGETSGEEKIHSS